MRVHPHASNNNNNNNELYLHGHKRELQYCKSILTITKIVTEANRIKIIKHSIINCLAFLNRMIRIALIVVIIHQTHFEKSDWSRAFNQFTIACELCEQMEWVFARKRTKRKRQFEPLGSLCEALELTVVPSINHWIVDCVFFMNSYSCGELKVG